MNWSRAALSLSRPPLRVNAYAMKTVLKTAHRGYINYEVLVIQGVPVEAAV